MAENVVSRGFRSLPLLMLRVAPAALAVQPCDDTPNPCYTNVNDVLKGKRRLLRNDDLVFTGPAASTSQTWVVQTKGLQMSNPVVTPLVTSECNYIDTMPRLARIFPLGHDMVVQLSPTATAGSNCNVRPNFAIYVNDPSNSSNNSSTPISIQNNNFFTGVADFNGDGLDEFYFANDEVFSIYGAVDATNPAKGLQQLASAPLGVLPRTDIVTGDFNADGAIDAAMMGLGSDPSTWVVYFRSVCPAAGAVVLGTTCQSAFQIMAASATINLGSYFPGSQPQVIGAPALAAGTFKGIQGQSQLVVWRKVSGSDGNFHQLLSFDIDTSFQITYKSSIHHATPDANRDHGLIAANSMDWSGQSQQLVFTTRSAAFLSVVTFDSQLIMTESVLQMPISVPGGYAQIFGLTVGRFDPPDGANNSKNFNLQIALLSTTQSNDHSNPKTQLNIFTVNPPGDFTPKAASELAVANSLLFPDSWQTEFYNCLRPGDFQGRSVSLGEPIRVTIMGHLQPDIVLAIPPMHIDYIRDVDNLGPQGKPSVLNLTVLPSLPPGAGNQAFNTEYAFSSTSSTSATSGGTTSYGFSLGFSSEQKATFGDPKKTFLSLDLKETGGYAYHHDTTTSDTSYQSVTNSLSATTGFADHLFYTASRLNIYYYQVLGQYTCPDSIPNCTDAQKQPVIVQFSGPDLIERNDVDATTQEWYQPVHEVGNVLSYPWNLGLLQQENPNLVALTDDPAPWRSTDTSSTSYRTDWKGGGGASQTTGEVNSHSFDFSFSATGQLAPTVVPITGMVSTSINYSHSDSISTTNTSAASLDASTGIQVNKPEFSDKVANLYSYQFSGYVLGVNPPNQFDLKSLKDRLGNPVNIQTGGPLRVAFLADPLRGGAPWWRQAYNKPDVALNHPARWSWSQSQQVASFNARDPNAPAEDDPFFQMKGLFITDADGQGPQRTVATAGDTVQLRARIHNFSLADMPSNAQVHVRFYGQVFKDASLSGNAFLIGEDVIGPIPGFNSANTQGAQPNWNYASVQFDTTNYANTQLVFWVVVWMNDGMNLIAELEGHGLTNNPAHMTFNQITDVPFETYSNNVGLYGTYSPFFVAAKQEGTPHASLATAGLGAESLSLKVTQTGKRNRLKVTLTVRNTTSTPLASVPVKFYDGHPGAGGKLFDVQRIWHLGKQSSYTLRTFFVSDAPGDHAIWARVGRAEAEPIHTVTVTKVASR